MNGSTQGAGAPRGDLDGLLKHWESDALSGFLVFLIALPLCLGISLACGYPAISGVFTAVIGAIVTTFISNSELTIKGPAAGLIVIAIGAITELREVYGPERAYQLALGVGVAAAALQILFGLLRAGVIGEFFPTSAVHGMLAAIGIIIMAKQIHITLGVEASGEPLELIKAVPESLQHMNPEIALIGFVSLAILFLLPLSKNKLVRRLPAPLLVIIVAVPLGLIFDLSHEHTYSLFGEDFQVGEDFLVSVPSNLFAAITFPDFEGLTSFIGWKWAIMFALIGSLESTLSAKAVDLLDPHKRKTDLDRDMLAVGIGNLACAFVGGLPMISEIVRSKANIDNGAKTRFADLFHGVFLLAFVVLIPTLIHRIPLAALSAMLVYTGFRLAAPGEFRHVSEIGREQLLIFVATIIAVLATDLLIGIAIGIGVKFMIHLSNGVPFSTLFRPSFELEDMGTRGLKVVSQQALIFSNWIPFKKKLEELGLAARRPVTVDLSLAPLVDHTVMEKLEQLQTDFKQAGLALRIDGLDLQRPFSDHPLAARKRGLASLRRVTVIAERALEDRLATAFLERGASGFTAIPCVGAGRSRTEDGEVETREQVRIECVVHPDAADELLAFLRGEVFGEHPITTCVETVEVLRPDHF